MEFNKLVLHNFGVYKGSQTIELKSKTSTENKNILLIRGKNGCGKTTLLDALQLVLFGRQAKFLSKINQPYETIVKESIHKGTLRSTGQTTAKIEVEFTASIEGTSIRYTIERNWRITNTKLEETLRVSQNNIFSKTLSKNWSDQVDQFFPSRLSLLYLFDGEQIYNYSNPKALSELLRDVLGELLGVDVIDRLNDDLLKYQQDYLKTVSTSEDKPNEISQMEILIENLEKEIQKLEIERSTVGTCKVDKKQIELGNIEKKFKKIGGDLFERKTSIENKYNLVKIEIENCEEKLRRLSSEYLPFLLVHGKLIASSKRLKLMMNNKSIEQRRNHFAERDRFILSKLLEYGVTELQMSQIERVLMEDAVYLEETSKVEKFSDFDEEVYHDIEILLTKLREDGSTNVISILRELKKKRYELVDLNIALDAIPQESEIKAVTEQRNKLINDIKNSSAELNSIEQDIIRQRRNLEVSKAKLTRLLVEWTKQKHTDQNTKRILQHTIKVKETLVKLRKRVLNEGIGEIERIATQNFCRIAHKSETYRAMQIDVSSYKFILFRTDGTSVGVEQLSSGERQLFCYALIWALRTASGRPLPIIMDTPLSRLDSTHRKNIVEQYIPNVSHQVVLLTTDEELVGAQLDLLSARISQTYNLKYDERTNSTEVLVSYAEKARVAL